MMPPKNRRKNSSTLLAKKGSILAFTKPLSASSLLKSKDGLKQGRIESFMVRKSTDSSEKSVLKKRSHSDEDIILGTPSPKSQRSSRYANKVSENNSSNSFKPVATIDLTTGTDRSLRDEIKNNFAGESSCEVKSGNIKQPIKKVKSNLLQKLEMSTHLQSEEKENLEGGGTLPTKIQKTEACVKKEQITSVGKGGDDSQEKIPPLCHEQASTKVEKPHDNDGRLALFEKDEESHKGIEPEIGHQLQEIEDSDNEEVIKSSEEFISAKSTLDNESVPVEDDEAYFSASFKKESESMPTVDEFGLDDSFLNAVLDELSPMKPSKGECLVKPLPFAIPTSSVSHSLAKIRFLVLNVHESQDTFGFVTKVLELENIASKTKLRCTLHDSWTDVKADIGDVVNIVGDLNPGQNIIVNREKNLIIVHPDVLLSGTTVSNAIGCKRRAILNEKFKNTENGDSGKPVMLIGTIVHTLFQSLIQSRRKLSHNEILSMAKKEASKRSILRDIISLGTTQDEVLSGVTNFIPSLIKWAGEYVRNGPTVGIGHLNINLPAEFENKDLDIDSKQGRPSFSANIALTDVKDIEENVWSPLYGMKGKIDATGGFLVQRRCSDNKPQIMKLTLPVELKTGRESHSTEHHAQVAIYSMFCKQRRTNSKNGDRTIPSGLLLYLKTGNLTSVPLKRDDERELMIIRNNVVQHMVKSVVKSESALATSYDPSPLPQTIDNERFCSNCSQLRNCALFYKSVEEKHGSFKPSKMMIELIQSQASHLSDKDLSYFNHWVTCILLETRKSMKDDVNQYYWLKSPEEREKAGSCAFNLVLTGHGKLSDDGVTALQTFKRSALAKQLDNGFSMFLEGDVVVVSGDEPEFVAMATGTVSSVSEKFLTIVTDRRFEGYPKEMKYSIDKHQWPSVNSFNASFHNLSVIMQDSAVSNRLRDLIIHFKEPSFKTSIQEVIPRKAKDAIGKMLRGLNRTQRQAIKRVLLSNDYTLVVGMPGSGKTTTIAALVRILLLCGFRVLLTSYTHSAIDNLLTKMIKYKVKFLRLGRLAQLHNSVHEFSEDILSKDMTTPQELEALYSEARVVGCTCLAVTSHALFTSPNSQPSERSRFDVCIVDEASQISQPACLAPLLHADRFVLVGDHRQLPPLVRSRKAKSLGADESLFWRLCHHKSALCDLTLQYRMNRAITDVSNFVTYEGRLECVSEAVANAKLDLPQWNAVLDGLTNSQQKLEYVNGMQITNLSWLLMSLDPDRPVVFLDTSRMKAYEDNVEDGICNRTEAEILKTIIENLINAGCACDRIGVIAPFRKQLKSIEESLSSLQIDASAVEINTVDKYQGRDKSVILMSFVRAREEEFGGGDKAGEILSDWRRLNVALTRAKHKMVLVGCQKTLAAYEPCKKLFTYLNDHNLTICL